MNNNYLQSEIERIGYIAFCQQSRERENALKEALAYKTMYLESKAPIEWIDIKEKPFKDGFFFVKLNTKKSHFYAGEYRSDGSCPWTVYSFAKIKFKCITHWARLTLPQS